MSQGNLSFFQFFFFSFIIFFFGGFLHLPTRFLNAFWEFFVGLLHALTFFFSSFTLSVTAIPLKFKLIFFPSQKKFIIKINTKKEGK